MTAITAWSYSRYACYALCPLQFKFKFVDKLPEPGSAAMQRGNDIHVGIAKFLQGKEATVPAAALKNPIIEDLIQQVYQQPNKEVEQQWGFTAQFVPTGWFGKDTWFRSTLDVGVMYEDMTFEAVDWKTGRRYGSNAEQMETQALAAMAHFGPITHVTTRLAYIDEDSKNPFEFEEFPVTHKQKLTDKWVKKVQPMFTDTVFAPRPNDKCRFCFQSRSSGGKCAFG